MALASFISRRNIIYPFFVIVIATIIFVSVYFLFFSQALLGENATLSVVGENVVVSLSVTNISQHPVKDPTVLIVYGTDRKTVTLKDTNNILLPGEKVDFSISIPLSETKQYDVYLNAPFNRTIHYPFPLNQETLEPVKATVTIAKNMIVGKKSEVSVRLCNVSSDNLYAVEWKQTSSMNYFEETVFPHQIGLDAGECQNLYSTLTPVASGESTVTFTLKVGDIVKTQTQKITITTE